MLIVEPGSFRTDLLGRSLAAAEQTDAYAAPVGATRAYLAGEDGRQAGDPARLFVHYHVGTSAARLEPRILARVAKRKRNSCIVSLIAWRDATMDDARWRRLIACHEVEILLIQALLART